MKTIILNVLVSIMLIIPASGTFAQELSIKQCHPDLEFKLKSCKAAGDVCVIDFTFQNKTDKKLMFNSMWKDPIVMAVDDEGYSYKSAFIELDVFGLAKYNNKNAKIAVEIDDFGYMGPAGGIEFDNIVMDGALSLEAGEKVRGKITIKKVPEESSKFEWIKFYMRNNGLDTIDRPIEIKNLPILHVEDE